MDCGFLGRPGSNSGDRRVLATLGHEENGKFGFEVARQFWTWVQEEMNPRLWRFCYQAVQTPRADLAENQWPTGH